MFFLSSPMDILRPLASYPSPKMLLVLWLASFDCLATSIMNSPILLSWCWQEGPGMRLVLLEKVSCCELKLKVCCQLMARTHVFKEWKE